MSEKGLIPVDNASTIFLGERSKQSPGSVVAATIEGTRPFLLEVQSLVTRTSFGLPRRMVTGYDLNRILLIIAVLEKRIGFHLEQEDVFVNIVGGVRIKETAVELGFACAIASAHRNIVWPKDTIALGEVGLAGEVRSISSLKERLIEAEKFGFTTALVPKNNLKGLNYKGKIQLTGIEDVSGALATIR